MRMRRKHELSASTVDALTERRNGHTLRALASSLDYAENYAPTLGGILRGTPGVITMQGENILRARLGLAPISTLEVPPCPDCGNVHTGRCHNRPVAAVVCLAPDETVRPVAKPRSPRKPAHRPYITDDRKWAAYQEWSRQYDAQEDTQP